MTFHGTHIPSIRALAFELIDNTAIGPQSAWALGYFKPRLMNLAGVECYYKGEFARATEYYTKALDLRYQYAGNNKRYLANSHHNVSESYASRCMWQQATDHASKGLAICDQYYSTGDDPRWRDSKILLHCNLADVWSLQGRKDEAMESLNFILRESEVQNDGDSIVTLVSRRAPFPFPPFAPAAP